MSLLLLLASFAFVACGGDSDIVIEKEDVGSPTIAAYTATSQSEAPVWQINWTNNQARPKWTAPDDSDYENFEIMMVQIEEALQSYVSADDMLAIFINGELRGLASPAVSIDDGTVYPKFLMKAYYNEAGSEAVDISLQYYCHQLKHLFILSDHLRLDSDVAIGIGQDFIPKFTAGSTKYPVQKTVSVENLLTKVGLTPVSGSLVGAFVGGECRGTASLSESGNTPLLIYGRSAGESVTLMYYDAGQGLLYTISDAVRL